MANKPIKIKRNHSVAGKRRQRAAVAKKVLSLVFVAVALLAMGFFGAPAVMEMLDNMEEKRQQQAQVTPTPEITPEITPEQTAENPSDVETDIPKTVFSYGALEQSSLYSESTMKAAIEDLKAKGIDNAVVTFKDAQGLVWFETQTEIGAKAKASVPVDVAKLKQLCDENGITLTAHMYVFQDRITPTISRDTAVKYKGTDMNWLDSSKELGGKPWANPASEVMQNYIYDLVKELADMGVDDFIFSGVQLPTGYSLEMRDFGVTDTQLQAQIQGFINTMTSKVAAKGGNAYFAFDVAAISGTDVAKYIVAPQRYGAANVVVTGNAEQFAQYGAQAVTALKNDENAERIVLWNTDGHAETDPQAPNGYFVK